MLSSMLMSYLLDQNSHTFALRCGRYYIHPTCEYNIDFRVETLVLLAKGTAHQLNLAGSNPV